MLHFEQESIYGVEYPFDYSAPSYLFHPIQPASSYSPWLTNRFHVAVRLFSNREFKHARFWDADGNRKRTFRVLGPYCFPDFYTTISNGEKILSNVNVVVWGQVHCKSENSSLPVAVRVSKTRLLKLPIFRSQTTSKCGIKEQHCSTQADSQVSLWCSYHILTSPVVC